MHYTGTVWRPPYEADSLLLEVTAGCTHHRCKFCTLYEDLPFPFRMSPLRDVEADLVEAQMILRRHRDHPRITRIFLVGANPFALAVPRLLRIGELCRQYFPECRTIGCFARVTDIAPKSDNELRALARIGYNGITIGAESGDDEALAFMDKGYTAGDILRQTARLDAAGITYCYTVLTGIAGAGRGEESAARTAAVLSQTRPALIGSSMLTVFPTSRLYGEIQAGRWREAGELEKLRELRTLAASLTIPTYFATLGASNAVFAEGPLPQRREAILAALDAAIAGEDEGELRRYRQELPHL